MIRRLLWLLLATLPACAAGETATPLPTLTLIPATATATVTPVTPTATRQNLPGPADIITRTPDPASIRIPAMAQPLITRALADLAQRLEISEDLIQLQRLEAAAWTSIDLGCGEDRLPGGSIEGFRIVLSVGSDQYEYHTDTGATVRLCAGGGVLTNRTEDLLLETDPVAAEMTALAQRRLADQLDLSVQRIQVVTVTAHTWTDSSLGCPQPGQDYVAVMTEGYRIVLGAGTNTYTYHTDHAQIIPCANEVLPD